MSSAWTSRIVLEDRPAIHAVLSDLSIDDVLIEDDLIAYIYDDAIICRDDRRYRWSHEPPIYMCVRGIYAAVYSCGSVIAPVHRAVQVSPACRVTCRHRADVDALVEAIGRQHGDEYF